MDDQKRNNLCFYKNKFSEKDQLPCDAFIFVYYIGSLKGHRRKIIVTEKSQGL